MANGLPPGEGGGDASDEESAEQQGFTFNPEEVVDAGFGADLTRGINEAKNVMLVSAKKKLAAEEYLDEIREESDIALRAERIMRANLARFPDVQHRGEKTFALSTDVNRYLMFDLLFTEGERPHVDTFRGRVVDWRGVIIDDFYGGLDILKAAQAMGLRLQAASTLVASLRRFGMEKRQNDMTIKFEARLPAWDGIERMESRLIQLTKCIDTPLNRRFGKYFWLSLYCRITRPGCMAPMVLSLFGGQNAGKSYFSKLICRTLMQDEMSDSVKLNLASDRVKFLRAITGGAIVATIPEMTGFNRADLESIKDFITLTSDDMDYKFEGNFRQQRQWVTVMDGNKYEGVQRDDTGNRRLYPWFVGQLPDKGGQPQWDEDFKMDFTGFAEDLWQLMAEAAHWVEASGGLDGYREFIDSVSDDVKKFSKAEMASARGTIRDYAAETYLMPALLEPGKVGYTILKGRVNDGLWISTADLKGRIREISRNVDVKENHLKTAMVALGAEICQFKNVKGYLFRDIVTPKQLIEKLTTSENDEDSFEVAETHKVDDQGGF